MPIKAGDVKLVASRVMDDVPEGGGAPTSVVIEDNANNAIFRDISEVDRAGGRLNMSKVNVSIQTPDRDTFLGGNVIVGSPPDDPNVSVTIFKADGPFEERRDAVSKVESYLSRGSLLSGYLFENHVAGQRTIQLFQRPGTATPNIGRSLALIAEESLVAERIQYVRVINATTERRMFSEQVNGQLIDFLAEVVTLDLSDALRYDFPGSPPSRFFAAVESKTRVRDTVVADAGRYYGVVPLAVAASIGDVSVKATTPYTQLVPSARTESSALDQKPAAQRLLTLTESPRRIDVGVTPHTMRIRVGQENRSFNWVQMLKPLPARGTIIISYRALGNWYTLADDGNGAFTGSGVGTISYTTGSLSITLPSLPDAGTSIVFQWGGNTSYTNRTGQAGFRAPEFAWSLPHQGTKPGSVVVTWLSGGLLKTATDTGTGLLTGASGSGDIDYATGKIYLRPSAMIDAGGEFVTDYEYQTLVTENFPAPAVDAGGFGLLNLSNTPGGKSVTVRWVTVRNVSSSSGVSEIVSASVSQLENPAVVVTPPAPPSGVHFSAQPGYLLRGQTLTVSGRLVAPYTPGTYTWAVDASNTSDASVIFAGGVTSGTFVVTAPPAGPNDGASGAPIATGIGGFTAQVSETCPDVVFNLVIKNQALTPVAYCTGLRVDAVGDVPPPTWPEEPPPPVIVEPPPDDGPMQPVARMELAGWNAETGARVYVKVERTALPPGSQYADPDGMGYDLPNVYSVTTGGDSSVYWGPSDFAAGFKNIMSVAGVTTAYHLWK